MLIFSDKGITAPTTEEIKLQFENIFINVFGADVNLQAQSVNGQLIQELVNNAVENNNDSLNLFNNYSIQNANGIFLDFIGENYNVVRVQGEKSVIQVKMMGQSGALVRKDTEISDNLGNVYLANDNYIISDEGFVIGYYTSTVIGSFLPVANTVTQMLTFVIGLDSVTNTGTNDTAGRLPETDADYRVRIIEQAFDSQRGTYRSLQAELTSISSDFIFLENYTDQQKTIQGVSINPHSIWISSNQGTDSAIANAIFQYKAIGCGMDGDITYLVDGYEIKFNRPTLVVVNFVVRVDNVLGQPPNIEQLIKNTILTTIQEVSKIGQTLYASDFICALTSAGVIDIQFITINGVNFVNSTTLELLTTTADNITVELGG